MLSWSKVILYRLLYATELPKRIEEVKRLEKLSAGQLKSYQDARLRRLLLYAYGKVPYYHRLLSGVVNSSLDNFTRIPVLTKEIIRMEWENLHSEDYKRASKIAGLSGFTRNKGYCQDIIANRTYFSWLHGQDGEPELYLLGSGDAGFKEKAFNSLYNRTFLNASQTDDYSLRRFVRVINRLKPKSIWSDSETIVYLANHINKNKIRIHSPEFIVGVSESFSSGAMEHAGRIFNCPVYHQYWTRETGPLVIRYLNKHPLNYFPWSHYIEIIDGDTAVTVLTRYDMPIIRYKIGGEEVG